MTNVTLKGNPVELSGNPPQVGDKAPDFQLTQSRSQQSFAQRIAWQSSHHFGRAEH